MGIQFEDDEVLNVGDIVSVSIPTRLGSMNPGRHLIHRKCGLLIEVPKPKKWSSGPVATVLIDGVVDYVPQHRIRKVIDGRL